jgi:hypothetical protein
MKKKGTSTALVDCAGAGDIVSIAGLNQPSIGHTISTVEVGQGSSLDFYACGKHQVDYSGLKSKLVKSCGSVYSWGCRQLVKS